MAESFAQFAKSISQNGFVENVTGKFVRFYSYFSFNLWIPL